MFPPSPPPTVFIGSESVLEFVASTTAVNSPFYVAESVLDLVSVPSVSVSVAVLTASVLDITSAAQPIFDVVTSESVLDVVSSAQQSAVAVIVSGSVLDFVPTSTQSPVGAVSSTSTLDLLSEVTVFPGVPAVGASVLDFNPSAIQTPVAAVTSQSVLDITSQGTVAPAFVPVGMLKSGSSSTVSSGSLKLVTGMVADPAFPGSTVSSNGVTILQSKSDATITMSVNCTNPFNTTITVAAYKNGVQIGTSLTRTGDPASFVVTGSVTGAVTAGDVITLMASAATGTTTINVANTFLNVT